MEVIYQGASIECSQSLIISKDIKTSSLVDLRNIGVCQKYNCKRNSEATIIEELNPKEPKHKKTSLLDKDIMLRSEQIVFYVNTIKKIKIEVTPKSHTHRAQKTLTNCFTYAEITKQFVFLPEHIGVKQKELLQPATDEENDW